MEREDIRKSVFGCVWVIFILFFIAIGVAKQNKDIYPHSLAVRSMIEFGRILFIIFAMLMFLFGLFLMIELIVECVYYLSNPKPQVGQSEREVQENDPDQNNKHEKEKETEQQKLTWV
jgi:pilus assembly protein TadC